MMVRLLLFVSCMVPFTLLRPAVAAGSPGDAVAGTYEILICKKSCSFADQKNVVVKGQLVLFADALKKVDLDRFDAVRFYHHHGEAINGCYTLETLQKGVTYAGIGKIGVTSWSQQGNEIRFGLFHSVDAGYEATVEPTADGLSGIGISWGAGMAAPKHPNQEMVVARRTGGADIFKCTFQTPEEAEMRRLLADPARNEIFALEKAYSQSLFASLQASDLPRDWAMAGWLMDSEQGTAPILRARKAAPDDVLIDWIAALQVRPFEFAVPMGNTGMVGSELRYKDFDATAVTQWQRQEPDNAAPWLIALRNAVNDDNQSAADAAFVQLTASAYYDNHASQLLKAQLDLFQQHPLADDFFDAVKRLDPGWRLDGEFTKDVAPYYKNSYPFAAIGINNLFFRADLGDGVHELFVACTHRPERSEMRIGQCATIGRMLAEKSRMGSLREYGSMLLSELDRFDKEDIERARVQTWIEAKYAEIHPRGRRGDRPHIKDEIAFVNDWIATGDEFEAVRRADVRAGKSLRPPVDWSLNKALFRNFEEARTSAEGKQGP